MFAIVQDNDTTAFFRALSANEYPTGSSLLLSSPLFISFENLNVAEDGHR